MQFSYRNDKNAEAISRIWGKALNKPDWYSIAAQTEDETEIIVYDVIGWPFIDADAFIRDLATIKTGRITVRINSPGGDVFDGLAIFNALSAHKAKIITRIEGLAASIASVVAMAGNKVQAYKSAMFMIHDPWVLAIGNQYDLRETADILEKISKNLLDIYADKSNVGKKDLKQMMKDETWMTAKEAQDQGFIDTVLDAGEPVKAEFDLSMFAHVPADLSSKETTVDGVIDKRTLERALRDVGLSQNKAKAFVARGYSAIDESATSLTKNLKEGMPPVAADEATAQVVAAVERLLQIMR